MSHAVDFEILLTDILYHALLLPKSEDWLAVVSPLTAVEIQSGEAASTHVQRISMFLSCGLQRCLAICRAQWGILKRC
jgi:hypothetical protein